MGEIGRRRTKANRGLVIPTYVHGCSNCGHNYEDFRFFSEPDPTNCPKCGAAEPVFHRVYAGSNPLGMMKGVIKTFGQQAEANAKRVGARRLQEMVAEDKARMSGFTGKLPEGAKRLETKAETPFWRTSEKPLDLSKVPDVKKYVQEGN